MSWTPERIGDLEKLWAEGHSTAEIGRRLGVSKNAVVGKAHRLRLPGRQSPIDSKRRQGAGAARKPARPRAQPTVRKPAAPVASKPAPRAPQVEAAAPPPQKKKRARPHAGPSCQWPYGDPRLPGFHFCGEPAESGKPYCTEHCDRAYNRVSAAQADARAAAAAAA